MDPLVIDRAVISPVGPMLGKGGQAMVYDLPHYRLPDVDQPLVYKEYRDPHSSPGELRKVLTARLRLDSASRRSLDEVTTWPCGIVEHDGDTVGVIMPRIPSAYFDDIRLPGSGDTKKVLREVQNLFIDPVRASKIGRQVPTDRQRLEICRDFAATLHLYHDTVGVVFGDINPKNELYRLDRRPAVLFLDCDGVRKQGQVVKSKQWNFPDWIPPEDGPLTRATDLYKLGLFVLRCLTPGAQASTRIDPSPARAHLDDAGMNLLERSLAADPANRPSAGDWRRHLTRALGEAVDPPCVTLAEVDRRTVLTGQSVTLSWAADEAEFIEISAGGRNIRIDGKAGHGVLAVVPERSGYIQVQAINDLGSDHRDVGPVVVLTPPVHHPIPVPMPDLVWPGGLLPELPAADVPGGPSLVLPTPAFDPVSLVTAGADSMQVWFSAAFTRCPVDIVSLTTGGPQFDLGVAKTTEGT